MKILDHNEQLVPEMPRFDDGMVNIGELIRTMLVDIVNGLVPEDDESVNKEAVCAAAFKLRDFVVPA